MRPLNDYSPPLLTLSIIRTEQEFQAIGEAWNALASAASSSVFSQHDWFDAAWAWRKEAASLFVLAAREGDRLVGVLPLIKVCDTKRAVTITRLEFLTVPDTQFCDLIATEQDRGRVAEAFCRELHQRRTEWDYLELRYLDANAAALSDLKPCLSARYRCNVETQDRNLYVPLNSSWDTYYSTRSRSLKKANNLAGNRLKKTGAVTVDQITPTNGTPSAIQSALTDAIDISRRSWKQNTGNSLDQPGPQAFIRRLTAHAARRGWLSVWLLSLDGKPLAMEYQLLDGPNVYALRADFDAAHEEISPGSHLMRILLESLFGRGMERYYMGPGKNAYKARWTEEHETLYQLTAYGRTWRGQLVRVVDNLLTPTARSLRDRLAPKKAPQAASDKHE